MNTLNLPAFASFNQAQRALFTVALSGCSTIPQRIEVSCTTNGIALRLYNKNKRPTVYSVAITLDKYGNTNSFIMDTIVNEMRGTHDSLKVTWSVRNADHIINTLIRLSEQPCNGNKDDTLSQYTPKGLLYWKNLETKEKLCA